MIPRIPIFVPRKSPRLLYILDWLFHERIGIAFEIITNEEEAASRPFCLSYGNHKISSFSIPDAGVLWEESVRVQHIPIGSWKDLPVLFSVPDESHTLPFDLFSALFYCISRYEEYLPYTPDKHGRYPATESVLYQMGCLERPIVDEWVHAFRQLLRERFHISVPDQQFSFQPTYDIDIAWSYRHKGFKRALGAGLKDLLSGQIDSVWNRIQVGTGRRKDPYDSFDAIYSLHRDLGLRPYYFILAATRTTPFDKNILPNHPAMQSLVRNLELDGVVGIHPSYYSGEDTRLLREEKEVMEQIVQHPIRISRQHYIRLKLPDTCRALMQHQITDDFSMGYGTHIGFRAGTGASFFWYDLNDEVATNLRMHPFCFMDTTARFEMQLSPGIALERLRQMARLLVQSQSQLITVFHNFSLGTDRGWAGWGPAYKEFLCLQAAQTVR